MSRSTTGHVTPIIYFRYPNGHIVLAPYSAMPTPHAAIREEADNLPLIQKLEDRLVQQEKDNAEIEVEAQYNREEMIRARIKSGLYHLATRGDVPEHVKEILKLHMMARDEEQRKQCQEALNIWQTTRLEGLHYDTPKGRGVADETYDRDAVERRRAALDRGLGNR